MAHIQRLNTAELHHEVRGTMGEPKPLFSRPLPPLLSRADTITQVDIQSCISLAYTRSEKLSLGDFADKEVQLKTQIVAAMEADVESGREGTEKVWRGVLPGEWFEEGG